LVGAGQCGFKGRPAGGSTNGSGAGRGLQLLGCCCSAVVVLQEGIVLTLEEVKVKEHAQHEVLQPAL